jgi:tetratricopeptide (TPR) repeat protein
MSLEFRFPGHKSKIVNRKSLWWSLTLLCLVGSAARSFGSDAPSASPGQALRQLRVGDRMPDFSLAEPNSAVFRYEAGQTRVLGVVVLQVGQTHLERLVTDVDDLVWKLRAQGAAFDCVGVMCGPGAADALRSRSAEARAAFPILADPAFALWGKLGVIAAPTAVVAGADHRILWVKAGYGYDFVAGMHAQLANALGLGGGPDAQRPFGPGESTVRVETLENTSSRARRDRHLQLARMLAKKGRWEAAMQELEKLRQTDPNAIDVALELGEVLCRTGKNEAALTLAGQIKAATPADKARALLISAWAKRQTGDTSGAESLLTRALELAPESPRILYELGKVHQVKGDGDKALSCYRRALAELFGDADDAGPSQK